MTLTSIVANPELEYPVWDRQYLVCGESNLIQGKLERHGWRLIWRDCFLLKI